MKRVPIIMHAWEKVRAYARKIRKKAGIYMQTDTQSNYHNLNAYAPSVN